jgi:hypothetical protein
LNYLFYYHQILNWVLAALLAKIFEKAERGFDVVIADSFEIAQPIKR